MRRSLSAALVALLLLSGCAASSSEQQTPPSADPPNVSVPPLPQPVPAPVGPPAAPTIRKANGGVRIQGVRDAYLWHGGGQRIAVAAESGLWSLRPDGSDAVLLATPPVAPLLVGAFGTGLIYLEQHPGALAAYLARPGEEPLQVALLEHGATSESYPTWAEVWRDQLLVGLEGQRLISVDLQSGRVAELGEETVPIRMGDLSFSSTAGVLAYKLANRADSVRLLRLSDGATLRPSGEQHVASVAWSPAGDRWAVRSAEAGAPLPVAVGADTVEGGTHLDVGDAAGGLVHLVPDEPLELAAGPWWSPDGAWLAVVAGAAADDEAPRELWAVALPDGEWRSLGPLPEGGYVSGFHPTESALMVHSSQGLALWPVTGEPPIRVDNPWADEPGPIALPDGSLLYLSPSRLSLVLKRPGSIPRLILTQTEQKGALTASGNYTAMVMYGEGPFHDLLVLPLPR